MRILYLFRGAPGSGKTSVCKALMQSGLIDRMVEADEYYTRGGIYDWDPKKVPDAHKWCQEWTEAWMNQGLAIGVSNTSTTNKECKPYYDLAKKYGYIVQELICRYPVFDNQHGVTKDKVIKYSTRLGKSLAGEDIQHGHIGGFELAPNVD